MKDVMELSGRAKQLEERLESEEYTPAEIKTILCLANQLIDTITIVEVIKDMQDKMWGDKKHGKKQISTDKITLNFRSGFLLIN